MKLFVVVYNNARLLSHFFAHYAKAGVTEFFVAVGAEFRSEVARYAGRFNIRIFDGLDVLDSLLGGNAAVTEMRRIVQRPDEWVVIVDLDEFIEFPSDIPTITATAEREGANVARGIMHDRFTLDGRLAEITPDSDLAEVFPITSRFIRDVMETCDHKAVLVRGHLKAAAAHHLFEDERVCSILLEISHYKWVAGAIDRLQDSYQRVSRAALPWGVEYKRALDHYESRGRFAWEEFGGQLKADFVPEPGERCADCGAPISEKEHAYSIEHFKRPLCRTDQKYTRKPAAKPDIRRYDLKTRSRSSGGHDLTLNSGC